MLTALLYFSLFTVPVWAQDSENEPDSSEPATQPSVVEIAPDRAEPRIHGRPSPPEPDRAGKPPRFVAAPSRDIEELSPEQCRSFPSDLEKYRAYQLEKRLWNLLKIASLGGSYGIGVCDEAKEAFDKAAELSGGSQGNAFEKTGQASFEKAGACRKALDGLYAKECGGYPGDAECSQAEHDAKLADLLDEQNKTFKKELALQEEEQLDLALCGKARRQRVTGVDAPLKDRRAKGEKPARKGGLAGAERSRGGSDKKGMAKVGRRIEEPTSASMKAIFARSGGPAGPPSRALTTGKTGQGAAAALSPRETRQSVQAAVTPSAARPSLSPETLAATPSAAAFQDCAALDSTVIVPGMARLKNDSSISIAFKRVSTYFAANQVNSIDASDLLGLNRLVEAASGVQNTTARHLRNSKEFLEQCPSKCSSRPCDCRSAQKEFDEYKVEDDAALTVLNALSTLQEKASAQAPTVCSLKPPVNEDQKACAANPACSINPVKHRALNEQEKKLANDSLLLLFPSGTAMKMLDAVLPPLKKGEKRLYDLASLRKAGVEVRAADQKIAAYALTYPQKSAKDGKTYFMIVLGEALLAEKAGAFAPQLGHEISHIEDVRSDNYGRSRIRTEEKAYLKQIYISAELETQKKLCSDQSPICQGERLFLRIWKDDLINKELKPGEFAGKNFIEGFNAALAEEKKGKRGTDYLLPFLDDIFAEAEARIKPPFTKKEKDAQKVFLDKLKEKDQAYRKANKFQLPKLK